MSNVNNKIIRVNRRDGEDASEVAARAARDQGTTIAGNLRWYGGEAPSYRAVATADGREVQVEEPRERDVAYIFEDIGGYHVCSDADPHLTCEASPHATKADAMRHAAACGYTHATGSGTYWRGVQSLANYEQ